MEKQVLSIFLSLALLLALLIPTTSVYAGDVQPSVYYVDSSEGDDLQDGKSESTAWKTFENVNNMTFQPGDKILLKSGGEWNEQLYPKGSGTLTDPITISSYGEGNKPLINGGGMAGAVVYLKNQSNWIIKNLEVTNYAPERGDTYRQGICVENNGGGTVSNIQILDNYVHHVSGSFRYFGSTIEDYVDPHGLGGISCYVSGRDGFDKFDQVLIQGNTVKESGRTGIVVWDYLWSEEEEASTNITIKQNYVEEIDSDGILTFGCNRVLIEHNVANGCGRYVEPGQFNGSCAIWPTRGDDLIVQYNEAYNTYAHEGNADGQGFDVDIDSSNVLVQYNYSHDNEGGFLLILDATGDPGTKKGTKNVIVRNNISQNDGRHIINFAGGIAENVQIYNNTFYIGNGLYTDIIGHEWDIPDNMGRPFYFKNNIIYNLGRGGYHIAGTNGNFDYNLYYGNHPASEPDDEHKLTCNPLFVNPGSGSLGIDSVDGYKLASNSPAIGSGMLIGNNGGRDYWGNPVSSAHAPNRGAYNGAGDITIPEETIVLEDTINAINGLPPIDSLALSDWYVVEETRTAVNSAIEKGVASEDIVNLNLLISSEEKINRLREENGPEVYKDDYNDASKVMSHSGSWGFNIYSGSNLEDDASQIFMKKGETGSVTYKTGGLTGFSSRLYYFTPDAIPEDGGYGAIIRFYVSTDNSAWVMITPDINEPNPTKDGWYGVTFSSSLIPEIDGGVNYFKIELTNASPEDWIYLLAWTEYTLTLSTPKNFELTAPDDAAKDLEVNPTLSWTSSSMADVYKILIDDNADFSSPEFIKNVSADTYSLKVSGLSNATTYYWKVVARNALGDTESSSVRNFTTISGDPDTPPVYPVMPPTSSTPKEESGKPKIIVEKDKEGKAIIRISEVESDTDKLPVIDVSPLLDNEDITWNNPDSPVRITIVYTLAEEDMKEYEYLTVNYIDDEGNSYQIPNARYNVKDGSISFITTKPGKYKVVLEKKTFIDARKMSWAQKPIEVLVSKGIIDKDDDEYHPGAGITRGEFISMIVRALGVTASVKENFEDVKTDYPYYQEIGIAKAMGIAKGTGENNYNPHALISRQDMMVITDRALEISKKLNIKSSILELNRMEDSDKVSGYAKQSVANLIKAGIIQGDGKNIMPKEYTNKASAAVVVYKILGL